MVTVTGTDTGSSLLSEEHEKSSAMAATINKVFVFIMFVLELLKRGKSPSCFIESRLTYLSFVRGNMPHSRGTVALFRDIIRCTDEVRRVQR